MATINREKVFQIFIYVVVIYCISSIFPAILCVASGPVLLLADLYYYQRTCIIASGPVLLPADLYYC